MKFVNLWYENQEKIFFGLFFLIVFVPPIFT